MNTHKFTFEWNPEKAKANLRKHEVSFEEAETVFDNPLAYIQSDEQHSEEEPREWIIGYSQHNRLLLIAFIQRAAYLIRIISARLATRKERIIYETRTKN